VCREFIIRHYSESLLRKFATQEQKIANMAILWQDLHILLPIQLYANKIQLSLREYLREKQTTEQERC
jgi:hypothetical protein